MSDDGTGVAIEREKVPSDELVAGVVEVVGVARRSELAEVYKRRVVLDEREGQARSNREVVGSRRRASRAWAVVEVQRLRQSRRGRRDRLQSRRG